MTARLKLETRALADLVPAPYNPREISENALSGLNASIERFGLVEPIIVNKRTGHVVGGHQRLKVLQARGDTETDVVVVDLPEADEKALNVALNSPQIAGAFTPSALALIEELRLELPDLSDALRLPDLQKVLEHEFPQSDDTTTQDEAPEPPDDPDTKTGDLYVLGRHRLLCGDATSESDVARLLDGAEPFIMVTDPPYGVEYDPEWRVAAGLNTPDARSGVVLNDERADWSDAFLLFPGDVAYTWSPGGDHVLVTGQAIQTAGFDIRSMVIWRKDRFAISRGAYHYRHEPCWYAVRKGRTARWGGDRTQSTIWDIKRAQVGEGGEDTITNHGTQKPVECMARPIRNHGAPGDGVYDPFVGSGTTIVAAEQLDRSCYAMEIDPAYCDVIVQRWENLTGQKAERIRAS